MYLTLAICNVRAFAYNYFITMSRLSSLTNDKNIVNYMSQFSPELVVPDIDTVKFIATDRATSYPLTELDICLSKLRPLKKKYDMLMKSNASPKKNGQGEAMSTGKTPTVESVAETIEDKEQKEFDSLRVSSKEYFGFTKIGPDLYSKISNPCFICNESAAIFYTRYNIENLKRSQVSHR